MEDPSLLDYQNAEMVLIGERADTERTLPFCAAVIWDAFPCSSCGLPTNRVTPAV